MNCRRSSRCRTWNVAGNTRSASKEIEYYNDEELDRFQGKESDAYTDEEEEEFRDVLYTMREDEVAGWVRSLQLRGVELPLGLRNEVIMIVGDLRGM